MDPKHVELEHLMIQSMGVRKSSRIDAVPILKSNIRGKLKQKIIIAYISNVRGLRTLN